MNQQEKYTELEIMRQQMEVLKKKLDTQEIINDKLLKDSMKKKMSWIKKYITFQAVLIPIIAIAWVGLVEMMHISWWSYFFLLAMCCIDVYFDYRINVKAITDDDYNRGNLIQMVEKLTKMKRQRAIHMLITIPMLILFMLWIGFESWSSIDTISGEFQRSFIYGGLVGGAIGLVCGIIFAFHIFFKMQHTNDEVIKQINEMKEEEE